MAEQRGKCLIVEDKKTWSDRLRRVPEQAECVVEVASSLAKARQLIEREFFHVALVDLQLTDERDDEGGLRVLELLNELREGTQSFLVTIIKDIEKGFEAGKYGARAAIDKQRYDEARLRELVVSALRDARAALKDHTQKSRNAEVELLRGNRLVQLWEDDALKALSPSVDINLIYTGLRLLLEPLAPLMPPKDQEPSIIDSKRHIVKSTLWSRILGEPVVIYFGRKTQIKEERVSSVSKPQIVSEFERLNIAGFAQIAPRFPFEDFKSPFDIMVRRGRVVEL